RLDNPAATLRPTRRDQPALLVSDDTLFLFGGALDGIALGDLWSFSLVDRTFRPIVVRHPQTRMAATLLRQFGGLVLLGGESAPFTIDEDGSTRSRFATSDEATGRLPYAERGGRDAVDLRLSVPGRLAFTRYGLRQRIYGTWPAALAFPDRDDVIGLDPRT